MISPRVGAFCGTNTMLLERDGQLAALRAELDHATAGRGRVAALVGEGGAGKTSLAEAFLAGLPAGVAVLRSACENLTVPDPLGPLHDLAREAGWPIERYLGDAQSERLPLFSAALTAFADSTRTTVVLVEDLHWADDATLDFVRYFGRRIGKAPALLLLTARDDASEGRRRLARALADVPVDRITRLDVPALSAEAVSALASTSGQDAAAIYAASAGNPFLATELIRAGADVLPASVRDATLARSERLSPAGQAALAVVSIFPRRVEPSVLAGMLDRADQGLSECIAHGMLEHHQGGYAFRHEIARRAVEAALTAPERAALNVRALAVLRDTDRISPARLVHHAAEAMDAAAVRELAPLAAYEASRIGAHREAAEHYRAMLRLADDFDPADRALLHSRYAFECHLVGRLPEAIEAQKQARALYRQLGDTVLEGDTVRWLSRMSYLNGCRDDAESYGTEAIALLETQPPGPELAMAYSNRAHLAMLADCAEDAITDGREAIALGQVLGRPDIISHALNNVGTARIWVDVELGLSELRDSLAIALAHNFQEHAARAYTNLGCSLVNALDLTEAARVLAEGIAYCRERDLDTWTQYMSGWLAETCLRQGDLDAVGDIVLPILGDDTASSMMRYNSAGALARLRLRRGDPGIDPLLAEMRSHLSANREVQRLAPYGALLAEQAWLGHGDVGEALQTLREAHAMTPNDRMHAELPVWIARLGAAPEIRSLDALPEPYRAELAGNWRRAATLWQERGAPFDAAMALAGGDEAAQREAVSAFEAVGAYASADRVRARMRQRGIAHVAKGPRRTTRDNALGLTRREMEILQLVGKGFSSKRIAADLAIAPKTVDHHVASLLEKLGSHSRGEAIALAREVGVL